MVRITRTSAKAAAAATTGEHKAEYAAKNRILIAAAATTGEHKAEYAAKNRILIAAAVFFVIAVIISSTVYSKIGVLEPVSEAANYGNIQFNPATDGDIQTKDVAHLTLRTTMIDFATNRIGLNWRVYPGGRYRTEPMTPSINMTMIADRVTRKFTSTKGVFNAISPIDATVVMKGNYGMYPFDVYTANFSVSFYELNNTNASIPTTLEYKNLMNSNKFTTTLTANSRKGVDVFIVIERGVAAKVYAIFISITMWLLSGNIVRFAVEGYIDQKRRPEGPVLGACIAMLFALPALRASQPGVPPVGILMDSIAFYWGLLLLVFNALSMTFFYIGRTVDI